MASGRPDRPCWIKVDGCAQIAWLSREIVQVLRCQCGEGWISLDSMASHIGIALSCDGHDPNMQIIFGLSATFTRLFSTVYKGVCK